MATIYINIHVPKNAGRTFESILQRYFDSGFVRTPYVRPGYVFSDAEKQQLLRRPGLRCISGHVFRYPAPPLPGVEYRYLAFLRHPVERLVSLYAYERSHSPETHSSHRSIEEWIEARLAEDNALRNYQAFHILGKGEPDAVEFEPARRVLDSFFFCGITELFDQSLLLLARKWSMSWYDLYYQSMNVTDSKSKFPLANETRQRLLDLNQVDLRLYEHARRRFERELEGIGPNRLQSDLARLEAIRQHDPVSFPLHFKARRRLRALARQTGLAW